MIHWGSTKTSSLELRTKLLKVFKDQKFSSDYKIDPDKACLKGSENMLKGRCTQILLFFKIIFFTGTSMRNSILVHFALRYFKMKLERTKCSKLFPNISLTKNDKKYLS